MNRIKKFIVDNFDNIGYLIAIAIFIAIHINLYINIEYMLDSDMSSEMILAELLAKENKLIISSWYYSTEIRILYMQLILVPLFKVFTSWKLIRTLGTVVFNILLYLSFIYCANKLEIKHKSWLSIFIIGGLSKSYYDFVVTSMFYTPIVICSFLSIGLIVDIIKNNNKKSYIYLGLVSLGFSLIGIREFATLYFPLIFTSIVIFVYLIIIKDKERLKTIVNLLNASIFSGIISIIGFLINKYYISVKYSIYDAGAGIRLSLSNLSKIKPVFEGWLDIFGYHKILSNYRTNYISYVLTIILIGLILLIVVLFIFRNKKYNIIDVYVVSSFLSISMITTFIFLLSNQNFTGRYIVACGALFPIIIGTYLKYKNINYSYIILVILTLNISFNTLIWIMVDYNDKAEDFINIVNILEDEKALNGYASFWEGNVLTELSNGDVEVWCFGDNVDFNINNRFKWLTYRGHDQSSPSGKVFLCMRKEDNANLKQDAEENLVYSGDNIVLYIFDSHNELESKYTYQ